MDTAEKLIPGTDTKIVLDELYYTVKGAMKKLILSSQATYNRLISQKSTESVCFLGSRVVEFGLNRFSIFRLCFGCARNLVHKKVHTIKRKPPCGSLVSFNATRSMNYSASHAKSNSLELRLVSASSSS